MNSAIHSLTSSSSSIPVIDPSHEKILEVTPLVVAPSIPMVVEPTCRYGHGLLAKQPSTYLMRKTAGIFVEEGGGPRYIVASRTSFAVTLWRCPVCAYVELFDPDELPDEKAALNGHVPVARADSSSP